MPTDRANDLKAFCEFADAMLANGGAGMTLEEALDRWEYENSPEEEKQETLRALQRGLEDMYAGRTVDAFEALREIYRKHGIAEPK